MNAKPICLSVAAAMVCLVSIGQTARAAFTVDFQQVGGNVVATGSGSIDTAALTDESLGSGNSGKVAPSFGFDVIGPSTVGLVSEYVGMSGPSSFGSGGTTLDTFGSG